jgi:hypothetical protein
MTKRSFSTARFLVVALTLAMACVGEQDSTDPAAHDASTHIQQQDTVLGDLTSQVRAMLAFQDQMRKLWEDHIVWTRQFIISAAHGLPDIDPTTQRLLANQVDIGNAFRRFYGDAVANQLTQLLTDHILIAAQIVTAAKAGDSATVAAASARWTANADEIAALWNRINPRAWPLAMMQDHMHRHLALTLDEAVLRLGGNFAGDIAKYDEVHAAILEMADMLSLGIIQQFPKKFP